MTVIDMDVKRRRKKKKASIQKYSVQGKAPAPGHSGNPGLSLVKPSGKLPEENDTGKTTVGQKGSAAGPDREQLPEGQEKAGKKKKSSEKKPEEAVKGSGQDPVKDEGKGIAPKGAKGTGKRKKQGTAKHGGSGGVNSKGKKAVKSSGKRSRKKKKKKIYTGAAGRPDHPAKGTSRRKSRRRKEENEYISGPFSFLKRDRGRAAGGEEPRIRWGRRRRRGLIALAVLGCLLLAAAGAFLFILKHYHINKVYVEGNTHYTNEEIKHFVTGRRFGDNSLYLSYVYKQEDTQNIPFIEKMDVKVLSADSIKITVYEKAVAGYVSYLDHYMYFDKDGIIVESVDQPTGSAPQVIGLDFDHVLLHEKLPVADDTIFAQILEVTQLMEKYEVHADKIYFNDNSEMTLYFGMARVALGKMTGIDEKIMKLKALLPELEGRRGVLQMENYTEETKLITFQQD